MAADIYYRNPNPNIGRRIIPGECIKLRVACWNIANARRDEEHKPLRDRLDDITHHLQYQGPPLDVLVLLEAGRPSKGMSWTDMAALIEKATGLTYMGIHYTNGTEAPFGKAFFIRRSTCILVEAKQTWLDEEGAIVAGPEYGYDVTRLTIHHVAHDIVDVVDWSNQVIKRRVVRDTPFKFAFVHLPMKAEYRFDAIEIIKRFGDDIIMGDWNTFPDDGGPEMIKRMEDGGWKALLSPNVMTFEAFPHDLCKKPASYREQVNPESEIVSENPDGTINVRFSSPLDQVFVNEAWDDNPKCVAKLQAHPVTDGSDHALMVATLDYEFE